MMRTLNQLKALLFVGATAFSCCTASAVTPAILIGPDLKPREVKLQSLGGGKMTFFDAERTMQIEPTGKVLQIRFPEPSDELLLQGFIEAPELDLSKIETGPPIDKSKLILGGSRLVADPPKPPEAFIELTDGQRLVGKFLGADGEGQKLRFQHGTLGEITVALDKVSRLAFDGDTKPRATPASDQILLSNGDTLTGFVLSVKDAGVDVQQGNAKPFTLPRDRVKGLVLANPVKREAGRLHMAWLEDGTRLLADEVNIAADKLTLSGPLAAKAVTVALSACDRIEFASLEGRLIDLADLPMKVTGGVVFGLPLPPRIEGDVIRMHAPVSVEFELPANAARFAALAELDAEGEDASLAEFIVSVRTTGETAASAPITGKQPRAAMNAPVSGKTLTITLDPAGNGPVMDRLRLRDAILFVESR